MTEQNHSADNGAARRDFLKRTGTLAALLPLLSLPGFRRAHAAPVRPSVSPLVPPGQALRMHYGTPANEEDVLQQGLPIGNGRIGALVGASPERDFLYISDASMWVGDVNATLDAEGQFPTIKPTLVVLSCSRVCISS